MNTTGTPAGCSACRDAGPLAIDFQMAFQPIVNPQTREIFAYEALVRGPNGEGAGHVLGQVNETGRPGMLSARVRLARQMDGRNFVAPLTDRRYLPGDRGEPEKAPHGAGLLFRACPGRAGLRGLRRAS